MKLVLIISTVLFFSFTFTDTKNPSGLNDTVDKVGKSFKTGQVEFLNDALPEFLELKIDSEKINIPKVSRERASFILNSFFKKNPPSGFRYVYQGNNSADLKYCVGNYSSKNRNYLIYMLIKKTDDSKYLIKTLQLRNS